MTKTIELIPVETPLITQNDDLGDVLLESLRRKQVELRKEDVVVVSSKIVSLTEKRTRNPSGVRITKRARDLAKRLSVDPAMMQLILDESTSVYAGSPGFVLAVRRGFPCVNACIDSANSPEGSLILPPADPDESAWRLKRQIESKTGKRIAVIVADSGLLPGRKGTIGVALGFAGLKPARNYVGKKDLYGREFRVTYQSVIDDLSSAAKLLMGEANERIPFVVVRGAPVELTEDKIGIDSTLLPPDVCVFMSSLPKKASVEVTKSPARWNY